MTLRSALEALKRAQREGYALPCFDTFEMMGTEGMIAALEERRAPGIVAMYAGSVERPNARAFAAYLRAKAEDAAVPISLMLDHGSSFEQCIKAIALGFTDVMYDGSQLPLEENIAHTKQIVRAAHAVGVGVEAELGHVGRGSEYQSFGGQRKGFTDPDTVERFVAETGVDLLAVAIGTAHGLYQGEPQVDIELLRAIRARVDIPLVLHGGSGLSDAHFRATIEAGISKINIFTDLGVTTGARLVEAAKQENASYFSLTAVISQTFQERCSHYLDVFGASHKV